jgi:hypothetical protein
MSVQAGENSRSNRCARCGRAIVSEEFHGTLVQPMVIRQACILKRNLFWRQMLRKAPLIADDDEDVWGTSPCISRPRED